MAVKPGRKSAAELDARLNGLGFRPSPPEHLTESQAIEWVQVVDRMPGDWFPRETHGVLAQYCRHVDNGNKIGAAISSIPASALMEKAGMDRFNELGKMHEREGRAMSSLATRMRLTQQSSWSAAKSASHKGNAAMDGKPWQ